MSVPFFELKHITKYFSKVIANRDVDFSIERGEVVALLGENGAGKSTLMKILYGLYRADEGQILMDGLIRKIHSPKDAMALGISMIQQHFSLVAAHTVIENIILGSVQGKIDYRGQEAGIKALAAKYGFDLDVKAKIRDLPVGDQQKVEILKALYLKTRLLIMDEPTAVLTPQETDSLMVFVKEFVKEGNAVIFITHKLKEVMEVADRIVVMRNGKKCGDIKKSETNEKELARLMIGKDLAPVDENAARRPPRKREALVLKNVTLGGGEAPLFDSVSFSVFEGEVLGIAGVSGNGQQELCEVICGARTPGKGSVELMGEDITGLSIHDRIQRGIGYVVSNRHKEGMVPEMTIAENMLLKKSFDKRWLKYGLFDRKRIDDYALTAIKNYQIKAPGPEGLARGLSGGNQQKVVLAREVDCGEKLIVFDQPTRGLDLGAIDNIHKIILSQREAGKSIILVSTELGEIFTLSDRIAVIYKGAIQGIFQKTELTAEKTGLLMAGYTTDKAAV
ncbi:MAG: ABC transporter ATP-binding protein [Spirochaetaceae bacterium]|jgi:simple sugar transport system ATP-binding protein|nr:ABC transporter ATP-binding protein [Spirochaetaceae bacterium]